MKNFWKSIMGVLVGSLVSVAIWILLQPKEKFTLDTDQNEEEPLSVKIKPVQTSLMKTEPKKKEIIKVEKVESRIVAPKPTLKKKPSATILININQASIKRLCDLPLIGESKAKAIVDYRNQNGDFSSIEGLIKVSGISQKIVEKIKPFIAVT